MLIVAEAWLGGVCTSTHTSRDADVVAGSLIAEESGSWILGEDGSKDVEG